LLANEWTIASRWYQELTSGSEGPADELGTRLLKTVVPRLISFIPACFGERRELGLEVWQQASHLYGSLAVRRGLAAGEVVEELQLLRNVILRLFLVDAPPGGPEQVKAENVPPLELLTLNRALDKGISRASVAYTDDLFFAHLRGSGVPDGVTPELVEETERQLEGLRRELEVG
jgi:hypothetical protein